MFEIRNTDSHQLEDLKTQYLQQATAPLDGMWLCGFVPAAKHYGFYVEERLCGFCCINDEGFVLQFYLQDAFQADAPTLVKLILGGDSISSPVNGTFASTAEPAWLSLCLDAFQSHEVHTLMYQDANRSRSDDELASLMPLSSGQLEEAVEFAGQAIGAPLEWVRGYFGNLIERGELFGVWEGDELLATGECRGYDKLQTDCADLGVIVAERVRGQGLATDVLRRLKAESRRRGLRPICSTEVGNIGAQKAITRAGFFAANRIVRFVLPSVA